MDQIIITPGSFSGPGDSGSLIVTNDADRKPVGLLYAGSDTDTIANRIDLLLNRFGVTIDGGIVDPVTDIAIGSVNAPASVVQGATVNVEVTVENTGNQAVGSFEVTLMDDTATSEIGRETVTDGLSAGASTIIVYSWNVPADAAQGEHQLMASHDFMDDDESNDSKITTVEVIAEPSTGPNLQTGTVTAWTDRWTLVTLNDTYTDMVVVCTPNYDKSAYPSAVQLRNASGNRFEVRLVPAVFGLSAIEPPWSANVHWMVVETGVYTVEEHGVKMEAVKFNSTVTDGSSSWGSQGSWVGQNQSYANSYSNPVVVGQVMTYNNNANRDYYWSVFWSRGSSSREPPSSTELWVGKHNAQDARVVNDETIGYIVIEAGEGTIGPIKYKAGLGSDSIRGMGNRPPYSHSLGTLLFTPATAILSQAAMDSSSEK